MILEKLKVVRNGVERVAAARTKTRGKTAGQKFIGFALPGEADFTAIDKEAGDIGTDTGKLSKRENAKWSLLQPWLRFIGPEGVSDLLDTYYGAQSCQKFFEAACTGLAYTCKTCGGKGECKCADDTAAVWEMSGSFDPAKFTKMVVEDSARSESQGAKQKRVFLRLMTIGVEMQAAMLAGNDKKITELQVELLKLSRGEI